MGWLKKYQVEAWILPIAQLLKWRPGQVIWSLGRILKKGPSQILPEAHGYLLALLSFYSGKENPEWANFLDKEVKKAFFREWGI